MKPNVRQLEAFKAVMDHGTISEAARVMGVSQPAITKSIRLLEQHLRLQLFTRVGGRLTPSLEAKCLFPTVVKIFDDIVIVDELAKQLIVGQAGSFRIAATFGHAEAFIPETIQRFCLKRPQFDIRFMALPPIQIMELIANHDIDFGIIYQPADRRFREVALFETDVVCLLPKRHPLVTEGTINAGHLAAYKLISYPEQSYTGGLLKRLCEKASLPWSVGITVNQTSTAISMVEAGLGIAVVDSLWFRQGAFPDLVIKPFSPKATLKSRAIYSIDRPFSSIYKEFTRTLSLVVKDRAAQAPDFFRPPSRGEN